MFAIREQMEHANTINDSNWGMEKMFGANKSHSVQVMACSKTSGMPELINTKTCTHITLVCGPVEPMRVQLRDRPIEIIFVMASRVNRL